MKSVLKKTFKVLFFVLALPVSYLLGSLLLSSITVNTNQNKNKTIGDVYLSTNGVHLDIVMPQSMLNDALKTDLDLASHVHFVSFGWGDENFYLNTPTWGDLTFQTAFKALFLKSSTLMHVTRYTKKHSDWVPVKVSTEQLQKLNLSVLETFRLTEGHSKQLLRGKGYGLNDDFYKAKGSYSIFTTCNSWVNSVFKASELKACLWTPFDFSLINKYKS